HLVAGAGAPAPGEDPGAFARRSGAHALLSGTVRVSGAHARVTWRMVDADRGAQIAAGSVRGAAADALHLEDELVADVRKGLGLHAEEGGFDSRAATRVPAAAERYQQALRYLVRYDNEASVDGAIAILERLSNASPDDAAVHATLARAYLAKFSLTRQHGWEGRAASEVEQAVRLAPDAPETMLALGELRLDSGEHGTALAAFERALALRPGLIEARLGVAQTHAAAGHAEAAEQACREVMAERPDDWRGYHQLGLTMFRRGEYERAVEPWRRVLQLTPDNARAASNLGSALFQMDRSEEAIEAYRRSLDLQPNSWAYSNLGTVFFYLGRYAEAVDVLERAVRLSLADPLTWGNLGNSCRHVPGMERQAAEALDQAIGLMQDRLRADPGDADGTARLAGWLVNRNRQDEARATIRRALDLAPDDVHAMAHAANVYCQLGEYEEALKWLEVARTRGFAREAIERAPDLAPLRGDPRFQRILEIHPKAPGPETRNRDGQGDS
ncbi:MAG: tetratricopeptide repeat protein, partial [Candidatus Eisenbacteria bacterium]